MGYCGRTGIVELPTLALLATGVMQSDKLQLMQGQCCTLASSSSPCLWSSQITYRHTDMGLHVIQAAHGHASVVSQVIQTRETKEHF